MNRKVKEIIISILFVAAALIFWLSASGIFPAITFKQNAFLWSAVISGFLFVFFYGLAVILVESRPVFIAAWLLSSFIGLLWLRDMPAVISFAILFFIGLGGYFRGKREFTRHVGTYLWRPMRRSIPIMATVFVMTISVAAYLWAPAREFNIIKLFPERYFNYSVNIIEPLARLVVPGFDGNIRFVDFMADQTELELKSRNIEMTPGQREAAINNAIKKLKEDHGIEIGRTDTLSHVLYMIFVKEFAQKSVLYERFFPVAFAVGLFVGLRILVIPVFWIDIILIILTLRLMRRFGIVELREIPTITKLYTLS